ncbi:hypothetical protein ERUR111494_01135 [Erysipelothrix urinaevulpis]|uniref:hypothetical protein n=1 Tax=Erysipelothrix urinaevulpis TaxID=2683717 RepID=UPI00135C82C4|nr:hypothetical protein [Erysipelothrix urinaevulpis]
MNKQFILGKHKRQADEGSILLSVVIVFLFLIIVLTTSSAMAFSNYEKSNKENEFHSAYYLAEAGIHEYTDKMVDYFSDLTTPEIRKLLKLDITEFAAYLETELTTRVRNQVDLEKKNADLNFTFESIDEVSDEFVLVSSATLGDETRVVKQTLKDVRASLENNGKNDLNFLHKYGLVVKSKAEFFATQIQGSLFFMNDNYSKNDIRFNSESRLISYQDKESYLFHGTDKSTEEFYQSLGGIQGTYLNKKYREHIKGSEMKIIEPQFEFPNRPKTTSTLSEKDIKLIKNTASYLTNPPYQLEHEELIWSYGQGQLDLSKDSYYLKKFHVESLYDSIHNSSLIINVGDKHVSLVVDDFKVEGVLTVKGSGSLTIYTNSDHPAYDGIERLVFNPFTFAHESQGRNGLVLIVEGDKQFEIKGKEQGGYISASFIANYIHASIKDSSKASYNIVSLGRDALDGKSMSEMQFLHNTINHGPLDEDERRVFIFAPYTKLRTEGVRINGFVYVNEFYNSGSGSTIRHDPDILNSLPPTVLHILSQLQTEDNANPEPGTGGAFDQKVIDYGPIREVE